MTGISKTFRIVFLFIFAFAFYCSKSEKNPFSYEDIAGTGLGGVNHFVVHGTISENSVAFPKSNIATSDDLLLGRFKGTESAVLVKFGTLAGDLDSVLVKRAYFFLAPRFKIADNSDSTMDVSIHRVTMAWDEESIDPLTVLNNFDPNPIFSGQFSTVADQADSLLLDNELVQGWIDSDSDNNGLLVVVQSADYMGVYYSDETIPPPTIKIVYEKQSVLDSALVGASEGLSILQSNFQLPPQRLMVGSGFGYSSFFKLDYSEIPKNATINKASLTLHVDTLLSIHKKSAFFEMSHLKANSQDWENFPTLADTVSFDTTHYRGGDRLKVDLTFLVQYWVNREGDDFGFRLAPYFLNRSLFRTVIFSSSVADSLKHPQLEVFYTIPPKFDQ